MGENILELKGIDKSFGPKQVLSGVSLSLRQGEILGLVGPNGAGKTTLIKIIMGLIRPTAGSLLLNGKQVKAPGGRELAHIGYVSDEPNLYDFMTVKQVVSFNRAFYPAWNGAKCEALMQLFKLPADETVKNLSRGTRAQLAMLLVLSQEPRLLVLDEPLEGLDPLRRLQVLNLLLDDFSSRGKCSIFLSSHYLEELERVADRVAFLQEGRLKRLVPMEQLKSEEKTIRVVFQKEPPSKLLKREGIKSVKQEGRTGYLITVEKDFNRIYEDLSNFPHFILEVYHRSIEDIFFDYSGEEKRDDQW